MSVTGVGGVVPGWVDVVQRESAQRAGDHQDGAVCCAIRPNFDKLVGALIPKDVQLLAADHQRMKTALAEFSRASDRVYYDAAGDAAKATAYYADIKPEAGPAALYDQLHALVEKTHTTKLDYDPTQELYPWVDLHPDGKLHSIYSGKDIDPSEAIQGDVKTQALRTAAHVAASMIGGLDAPVRHEVLNAALPYNCEHVVPQSWFDKKLPQRGDLHHLFACDPGCNSMRGSVPYSEQPGEAGTTCGKISSGKNSFEPAAGKGAVARATLYFLLRYPGSIGDRAGEYNAADLKTLIDWSKQYPVNEYEHHRNAAIQERQGNRNPLIDHPEWVDKIDFTRGLGHHG